MGTWAEEVAADNPVIWHKFNGNITNSGSLSTTVTSNGPTFTTGTDIPHGTSAAVFNGTSHYIQHVTNNDYYQNGWSIEAWFKIQSASFYNNLTRRSGLKHVGFRVRGSSLGPSDRPNILEAYTYDNFNAWGDVQSTGYPVNDNKWHHAVVTRAPGTGSTRLRMYVDGVEFGGGSPYSAPISMGGAAQQIGREESGSEFFGGQMDELIIYNTELSFARVLAHYNAPDSLPQFRGWGIPLF